MTQTNRLWQKELDIATDLARKAGDILLEIYKTDFEVASKGEAGPVTQADLRANKFLVDELHRHFPEDGIVAEEGSDHDRRDGRTWFVDPLDGTKEFVKKNGEFSVMIGFAIDGQAKVGVVFRPDGDVLYRGAIGGNVEVILQGKATDMKRGDIPKGYRMVISRSHPPSWLDEFEQAARIESIVKTGSVGLKIGLIAANDADLYVNTSNKSCRWDACAADAIITAAGGIFVDLRGQRFDYREKENANSFGILACSGNDPDLYKVAKEVGTRAGLL